MQEMFSEQLDNLRQWWASARMWAFIGGGLFLALLLTVFVASGFVSVPDGKALILIKKTGDDLAPGAVIATSTKTKGIQLEMRPEGWYFFNPYSWDTRIVNKVEVPEGKLGVLIRLFGKPLDAGEVIAGPGQKGVTEKVLLPGRHTINPYAYRIELQDKVSVRPGYLGIVVLMSGKLPKNPNVFLVDKGERGVQKETISAGDYYVNPYVQRIIPLDMRAHKLEMMGSNGISFPSKDGFTITMDGTVEWYIDRKRAPRVFVEYVDADVLGPPTRARLRMVSDEVIRNIVDKIILPYARAISRIEGSQYLARDFISGSTRQKFQDDFLRGMQENCGIRGIIIKSALVKNVVPPTSIVTPIKKTEIAIRQREKYRQQMEREKQQKRLSIEKTLQTRAKELKQAQADVSVSITNAQKNKQVAIINAKKKLQYALLQLEAAKNEAAIILANGKAKADVIRLRNKANAQGLKEAANAFGNGQAYVRYLLYQKLAPSFRYILSNTDGPFLNIFKELTK